MGKCPNDECHANVKRLVDCAPDFVKKKLLFILLAVLFGGSGFGILAEYSQARDAKAKADINEKAIIQMQGDIKTLIKLLPLTIESAVNKGIKQADKEKRERRANTPQ